MVHWYSKRPSPNQLYYSLLAGQLLAISVYLFIHKTLPTSTILALAGQRIESGLYRGGPTQGIYMELEEE